MSRNKYKGVIIVLSIIVIMLLVCAAGIIIMKDKQATEYDQYISTAENYFKEEDYENAIVSYKEAIKKNDKNEEAYIGIAKTYYKMNDLDSAVKYLQRYNFQLERSSRRVRKCNYQAGCSGVLVNIYVFRIRQCIQDDICPGRKGSRI